MRLCKLMAILLIKNQLGFFFVGFLFQEIKRKSGVSVHDLMDVVCDL